MPRPKKEPTEVITIRVPREWLKFLKTLENRNTFMLDLVQKSEEYKSFLTNKRLQDNEPKLFN